VVEAQRRVRVGLVDDSMDIRVMLRFAFEQDERFEIVGEASNGKEAIELVAATRPDLLVLDRRMPVMGGVEALPEIHRRSGNTLVVMYTAGSDENTDQAALAAGAARVLEKEPPTKELVDRLASILVGQWARPDADVEVRVGPVRSAAARAWIDNTTAILTAVRAHPEVLDRPVPEDVLDLFDRFLSSWREVAATETEDFYWVARGNVAEVRRLVENWTVIDLMSDEQLDALGIHWSGPEGQPFFHALTAGVLRALERHEETQELAARLSTQWPQPDGG
jgi:DNA-binding NarL/FixJ family response regulator